MRRYGRSTPVWIDDLQMVSADNGWALIWNANPAGIAVLEPARTSNGGRTWVVVTPARASEPGRRHGQDPVRVYGTADGGVTWSLLASGLPVECGNTGMAFGPARVGWITSDCVLGYQVLVSRDGGAQWATAQLPLPSSACADGCSAFQAQFAGPGTMLEVGSHPGAAVLLLSTDSGQVWRTATRPAGAGPYPRITFFGADDAIAVSAGAQGAIGSDFYLTSDRGLTWTAVPQERQFASSGAQFDFVDPQIGFAWIADGPGLYRTADSGRTWRAVVAQYG